MIGSGLAAHEALRLLMAHGCTKMHDGTGHTEPLTELRYAVTDDFAIVLETDGLGTLLCRGLR